MAFHFSKLVEGVKNAFKDDKPRETQVPEAPVQPEPAPAPAEPEPEPVQAEEKVPEMNAEDRMKLNRDQLYEVVTAVEKLRGKLPDVIPEAENSRYMATDAELESFLTSLEKPVDAVLDLGDLDHNAALAIENLIAVLQNNEVHGDGTTTWQIVTDLLKDALLENRFSGNPDKVLLARAQISQVRLYEELADKNRFIAKLNAEKAKLQKALGKLFALDNPTDAETTLMNALQNNLLEVNNNLTAQGMAVGQIMGQIKSNQLNIDTLRNYSTFSTEQDQKVALKEIAEVIDELGRELEENIAQNNKELNLGYQKQKMRQKRLEDIAPSVTNERQQDLQEQVVAVPVPVVTEENAPAVQTSAVRDEVKDIVSDLL